MTLMEAVEACGVLLLEPREDFDRAIVGLTIEPHDQWPRKGQSLCAVYSSTKCISALMEANDWDEETAMEWFVFNVSGAWVGEGTPTFVDDSEEGDS